MGINTGWRKTIKRNKIFGFGIAVLITLLVSLPVDAGTNDTSVRYAAQKAENDLLLLEGITGISYREDPPRVIVMIEEEQYSRIVPKEILGVKTEMRITGKITALGFAQLESIHMPLLLRSRHDSWDSLVGGISVGTRFLRGSYGTLSVCTSTGPYLLSCTHVLAMTDGGIQLPPGIAVIQPGSGDGGGPVVGHLKKYIRIKFGGILPNYADAAIATLQHDAELNTVLGIDNVSTYNVTMNIVVPDVGQTVRKSGVTTGVTQNLVIDNHATIIVRYGYFRRARFNDVIVVEQPFIHPGDSGSFVDVNGDFVGLGFAGGSSYGFVCKASYIKSALGI
jgi:hypothetical protein